MKKILVFILLLFLAGCTDNSSIASTSTNESSVKASSHIITKPNHFAYQEYSDCSGYAAAYAIRSLGHDATGPEIYAAIPNKNSDGTVIPNTLYSYLKDFYNVSLSTGNITILRYLIRQDIVVICSVEIEPDSSILHYLPIVGYDDDYFYAAESASYWTNIYDNLYYNRRIAISDFLNMWNIEAVKSKNVYLTIKDK